MNLLIVDDEILVVDYLKMIIKEMFSDTLTVFEAYNVEESRKMMSKQDIQIVLCDIEMPMGNGMELLEWIRQEEMDCSFLFLTCHEEFKYAQKALQLGCSDYLLKPIEPENLKQVLYKTVRDYENRMAERRDSELGKAWKNNVDRIKSAFWQEVLFQSIDSGEFLQKKADEIGDISYFEGKFFEVLISIKNMPDKTEMTEKKVVNFALENIAKDIFAYPQTSYLLLENYHLLILIPEDGAVYMEEVKDKCIMFDEVFYTLFGYKISAYISGALEVARMSERLSRLMECDKKHGYNEILVYTESMFKLYSQEYVKPPMEHWERMIKNRQWDQVKSEINQYYMDSLRHKSATRDNNLLFIKDIDQLLQQAAEELTLDYSAFIDQNEDIYIMRYAAWENLVEYISVVLDWLKKGQINDSEESIIEKVKKYILKNVDQELTREMLAEIVFLNPDYLNRIFKKREGVSIKKYISDEKYKVAEELLVMTDIPVSEVGMRVGFYNFAYFSSWFKKRSGMAPVSYRQKYGKMNDIQ